MPPLNPANQYPYRAGRSFYRRFLPSKRRRRKSHKSGAGARSPEGPEEDSLVDAPATEFREKERHRERKSSRYRRSDDDDRVVVEEVVVVRDKIPRESINGHGGRREKSRYRREEDEESLVDSVDRNEAEKIVRRRERERRNGPVEVDVREKRREYYDRERG